MEAVADRDVFDSSALPCLYRSLPHLAFVPCICEEPVASAIELLRRCLPTTEVVSHLGAVALERDSHDTALWSFCRRASANLLASLSSGDIGGGSFQPCAIASRATSAIVTADFLYFSLYQTVKRRIFSFWVLMSSSFYSPIGATSPHPSVIAFGAISDRTFAK